MNDRVSAAPPADFLGPDSKSTDYEKQFAMDWKPPDLDFAGEGYSNVPGNRASFVSVRSSLTTHTTKTAAAPRNNGFFSRVGERLGLRRSRSSLNVGGREDEDENEQDEYIGGGAQSGFLVPPASKHHRSESVGAHVVHGKGPQRPHSHMSLPQGDSDFTNKLRKHGGGASSASAAASAPLPGFDPSKRPTREEITANYQSLLASGFFGTHAIQSTRFAAPGRNLHHQEPSSSVVERLVEDDETSQGQKSIPPSPQREPPPPPPPERAAPPPPTPPSAPIMSLDTDEPANVPTSPTAILSPPSRTRSKDATKTMPPPPIPAKKLQSTHKPALSFSSVPYSQTRQGANPIVTDRPYRPPPVSLARFSVDIGRGRSLEIGRQRGTKRPFTSTINDSQPSFASGGDHDYDMMDTSGGIGVATTTSDEEKHESGARKLVKRLRKSASKISMDLGRTMSRQSSSSRFDASEKEDADDLEQAPSRTSLSSSVRRSFSWRLGSRPGVGAMGPPTSSISSSTDLPSNHNYPSPSLEDHDFFAGGRIHGDFGESSSSLNNAHSSVTLPSTSASLASTQPATLPNIPILTVPPSPTSAERNRLKKREIRGRRLRRSGNGIHSSPTKALSAPFPSPLKQPPMMVSPSNTANLDSMEWQQGNSSPTKSRSRSRPRRSEASLLMHARETRGEQQPNEVQSTGAAGGTDDSMEGVEFSFHFPGRMKGPLAIVPDLNRGIPNVPEIPGAFKKKAGSVRVVRDDARDEIF